MRLHRLIAILMLLESRKLVRARDLAQALETSERTVYRDIDVLCEAGIPILATTGPNGGFSLMDGYSVKAGDLRGEDVVNLYLSGIGVRPEEHTEASLRLADALLRLECSLPTAFRPDVAKARERFYFDPTPWWNSRPALVHMDVLRRAVWDSRCLQISYGRASVGREELTTRVVRPYGLVEKAMDWYLVAWCELRQGLRVFRCDRIQQASLCEESFALPAEFFLAEFWSDWVEQFKSVAE